MKTDSEIHQVYKILKKEVKTYDVPVVELIQTQTKDPFKILVATILSARTQDRTTAHAASRLFRMVNTAADLEDLTVSQIEKLIYPVGFYKTKARHLKQLPGVLKRQFDNKIPKNIDALIKLPGVGRKTANLVVALAFKKPAICVDTHVHRISNRLGYVTTKTSFDTEMALRKKLPKKYWTTFNTILVAFGQNTCRPINPKCHICPITRYCNYFKREKTKVLNKKSVDFHKPLDTCLRKLFKREEY